MKKYFLLLVVSTGLNVISLSAEEPAAKLVENRFLLVVETSAATSRSSKSARGTVRALIESGIQGQMRPGDTLGLWTFNEQLSTSYPMQQWSPSASKQIGDRADVFLKKMRFEKKSQLNVMLEPLESVVQGSKAITVILISSGNDPIHGTPFDHEINAVYSVYARSLRDSKLPFVTILIGRNGKLVTYAVNSALDAIQIPNLPWPLEPDLSQVKSAGLATANKVAVTATNQIAPPRKFAKANIILTQPIVTNQPPLTNNLAITNAEVNPAAEKTNALATRSSTNVANVPSTLPALVVETNSISPPPKVVIVTTQGSTILNPATNSARVEKVPGPNPVNSPAVKFEDPTEFKPQEETVDPVVKNMAGEPVPAPFVATQSLTSPRNFVLIGASLLVIAGVLAFLLLRNSRSKSHTSLISKSMKQPPK